jgi:hypothetical protein
MTEQAVADINYAMALTHVEAIVNQLKADSLAGRAPDLEQVLELAGFTTTLTGRAVDLHRQLGTTWTGIGEQLGISKQAAQQRFSAS